VTVLRGVDYSFPGSATFVKPAGFDFAIVECSIGMHDNASGSANLAALKKAGVPASLYHYCIFENDPVAEANALVSRVKRFEDAAGSPCDFAISIDIEEPKSKTDANLPMPALQIIAWLDAFVPVVRAGLGYFPLAYTYNDYARMLGLEPAFATCALKDCPLWLADSSRGRFPDASAATMGLMFQPTSPFFCRHNPWRRAAMFQSAGNATVPGIPHIVDVDVFFGSIGDLSATARLPGPSIGPAPPNALPAPVAEPVKAIVSGRAPLYAALLAAVAGAIAWAFQHWRR
jgi:GH25 family lysozyme M1 (1,4-beta-N-acetylmuramidase)